MRRYLDPPSTIVAAITLTLFVAALFVKGLTHDLFLEAGVFLVSAKLLMMIHENNVASSRQEKKLDMILDALARLPRTEANPRTAAAAGDEQAARLISAD